MRRSEKKVTSRDDIDRIIGRAQVCRLAMVDGDVPYIVPLNFGYSGDTLYFHSAREGRKIDVLARGGKVCFEIDGGHELVTSSEPCNWSMRFESVIGYGAVSFIDQPEQKLQALECIMAQYSPEPFSFPEESVARIAVFALQIESMTAKRS